MATVRTIVVATHGRYLVEDPRFERPEAPGSGPPHDRTGRIPSSAIGIVKPGAGLLIGFHGYAESADIHMERLRTIPASDSWMRVSVQALHRFYRGRSEEVVASWMTRQDRELMIADTIGYVSSVVAEVRAGLPAAAPVVFAGFSQGVATAFRAACASTHPAAVIALGGDIPPEIDSRSLAWLRGALIGRGSRDEWYTAAKFDEDVARLREAGVPVRPLSLDGGHEWTTEFSREAGAFLAALP
jgi:predicted esterase